jgi:hypothetical protein
MFTDAVLRPLGREHVVDLKNLVEDDAIHEATHADAQQGAC